MALSPGERKPQKSNTSATAISSPNDCFATAFQPVGRQFVRPELGTNRVVQRPVAVADGVGDVAVSTGTMHRGFGNRGT